MFVCISFLNHGGFMFNEWNFSQIYLSIFIKFSGFRDKTTINDLRGGGRAGEIEKKKKFRDPSPRKNDLEPLY